MLPVPPTVRPMPPYVSAKKKTACATSVLSTITTYASELHPVMLCLRHPQQKSSKYSWNREEYGATER